jgi:basic membrane protein A
MAPDVAKAARRYPDVRFAIADVSNEDLDGAPRNVRGLVFEEQEAGYLAGYLAGLLEERESGSLQTISSVGGRKGPAVDRYIGGFQAGALDANLQVTTHNDYAGEVSDQAKCKELALNQIGQGSDIVFAVAGRCGLGALEAAKERNVWGIGADTDLGYLGPHVLTSAVKRVDVAVFETIRALRAGTFTGGEDAVFDVASGGVGLGRISPRVPSDIVAQVKQMQSRIASGSLGPIRETVR